MTRSTIPALVAVLLLAAGCATPRASKPAPAPAPAAKAQAQPQAPAAQAPAAQAPAAQAPAGPTLGPPPATAVKDVTDTYHGVKVVDPYQWLEDWSNPKVQAWSNAQNVYARHFLDALPGRDALARRIEALIRAESVRFGSIRHAGHHYFAMEGDPKKQQAFLIVLDDLSKPQTARVLVDPNVLDPSGHTAIDFYRVSPDGKHVAVSLSQGGSEAGSLHLFDVATGKPVDSVIPRVNGGTAGGDAAFTADGKGLYYTRYPAPGERPAADLGFYQQLWYHRLGTPLAKDHYVLGKQFPKIAEVTVDTDPHSSRAICTVQDGDSGRFAFWLRTTRGKWVKLAGFDARIQQITFGPERRLYVLSHQAAPKGKILSVSVGRPDLRHAKVLVPEGKDAIAFNYEFGPKLTTTDHAIFAVYQLGGPTELRAFSPSGKALPQPKLLPVSAVYGVAPAGGDAVVYANVSYTQPLAWYRYDVKTRKAVKTGLFATSPVSFADAEVKQVFATSQDGTQVPLTLLYKKGTKLDGHNPVILTGYGSYGITIGPGYSAVRHLALERGYVLGMCHIRGGGAYGDGWHADGSLTHRQNNFNDFYACMHDLVKWGWTSPSRLAITGGSAGGLLMGGMITQHPDAFRAVVSYVGFYDMLRTELSPNGAFNIPEFGTVKDPAQFKAMYALSPYHHVVKGTAYPAILFMTGANDPRVNPMQSRKMTARLQAATSSGRPVLLRTSADTGHGIGSPLKARIAQMVDADSFISYELGVSKPEASAAR